MRDGSPLVLHYTLAFLLYLDAVTLGSETFPTPSLTSTIVDCLESSAFLLPLYPSHVLSNVYSRLAFELDFMIAAAVERILLEVT